MKLHRKRALITGASMGFGLAVAQAFVAEGAHVMLCARNADALAQAAAYVRTQAQTDQIIAALPSDVSQEQDVQRLVNTTLEKLGGCDVLVSNAGVYGPKGSIETINWDEWVQAININLLGSVLVCRALVPHFKAQGHGKIILLSGGGATNPLPNLSAYAASKAAIVRFGETLAEELRDNSIDVNAVAPGALNTRLLDEVLEAGPQKVGKAFYERALKQKTEGGAPLARGAALCVYLASDESDGITGKLLSAIWDPWETLSEHRSDVDRSDVYTLRRIVPKDRGLTWS